MWCRVLFLYWKNCLKRLSEVQAGKALASWLAVRNRARVCEDVHRSVCSSPASRKHAFFKPFSRKVEAACAAVFRDHGTKTRRRLPLDEFGKPGAVCKMCCLGSSPSGDRSWLTSSRTWVSTRKEVQRGIMMTVFKIIFSWSFLVNCMFPCDPRVSSCWT